MGKEEGIAKKPLEFCGYLCIMEIEARVALQAVPCYSLTICRLEEDENEKENHCWFLYHVVRPAYHGHSHTGGSGL